MSKCFCHFNGYEVKDAAAREGLDLANARLGNMVANSGEQTEGNLELIDIRTGADGTVYQTAGDSVRGQITDLKSDLSKTEVYLSERYDVLQSANLYDATQNTDGYYIPFNSTTGKLEALEGFSVSDFIPVVGGGNVIYGRTIEYDSIGSLHTVFYDASKNILSTQGIVADDSNNPITIPTDACFMRFSMSASKKASYSVANGISPVPYGIYYRVTVPKDQKFIDVEMPASENLRYWLEGLGSLASENHIIRLHIPQGKYLTVNYYTVAERADTSFVGMFLPNYMILVGHDKEDTVLSCVLDSPSSAISTINLMGTSGLKNLTIEGTNTRYAIHDDFATSAYTTYKDYYYRWVEDCIIKATNPTMGQAYGSGSRSGAIWKFKNVDFIGGFSWHTNTDFTTANDITLEDCTVESLTNQGVVLKSLGSGVANRVHFIGCSIGMITCTEEASGLGIDFEIDGHGNNDIPVNYLTTAGAHPVHFWKDKMLNLKCLASQLGGGNIEVGNPILRSGIFSAQFGSSRDAHRFSGIAIEQANDGSYGKVLQHGYFLAEDLGMSDFASGSLLTISNGEVVVSASSSDYIIGYVDNMWATKFVYLY